MASPAGHRNGSGQDQQLGPPIPQPSSHQGQGHKRKGHRAGKKKRNRRQSFAASADVGPDQGPSGHSNQNLFGSHAVGRDFNATRRGRNLSNASLDSQALLDHREQQSLPPRRQSAIGQNSYGPPVNHQSRPGPGRTPQGSHNYHRSHYSSPYGDISEHPADRPGTLLTHHESGVGAGYDEQDYADDRTPLISSPQRERHRSGRDFHRRGGGGDESPNRPASVGTSASGGRRKRAGSTPRPPSALQLDYDINNPPSVPSSPQTGADVAYDDVMIPKDFALSRSPQRRNKPPPGGDVLIEIDQALASGHYATHSSPATPQATPMDPRKRTLNIPAEEDVCFPVGGMSDMADEDVAHLQGAQYQAGQRRRRANVWPDLSVLEEWSMEEKEERSGGVRAKTISEPVLVGGRLRPNNRAWHKREEDAPYRFTYFNEEVPSTIHSQTISELLQPGHTFRELFIPDLPELSDDESDEEDLMSSNGTSNDHQQGNAGSSESKSVTRHSSALFTDRSGSHDNSGDTAPSQTQLPKQKPKRYGPRPLFWLDVLSPTDAEMKVIAKTFGIHPLTAEDIMMQEAREKVELFRNYYFVNYRTFEQDANSEHYLEPVNLYVVVFREGVISFHFYMVPHPANVRRRIRQLKDYLILSSDWISYAIIDDITDAFGPLSQSLEDDVDEIEDIILTLHSSGTGSNQGSSSNKTQKLSEKKSENGDAPTTKETNRSDLLKRVGDCRRKVMGLYRLLGNKADVIKGFAKRCNEQWDVAPKSEIGLYLGDIQDHIITMTSNLSHCEGVLSRAHSNYLAQINITMNERQEQTADVLGRLTVLGTIVLPMNIITGLWGMNCLVPGQGEDSLNWFWSISASLGLFGIMCYFIARKVYGIV